MDTVGIILLHVILLPIPIVKHRGPSQWCPHTLRMTDHHWQAIWVNRHYFGKWWEELQESSDWWVILICLFWHLLCSWCHVLELDRHTSCHGSFYHVTWPSCRLWYMNRRCLVLWDPDSCNLPIGWLLVGRQELCFYTVSLVLWLLWYRQSSYRYLSGSVTHQYSAENQAQECGLTARKNCGSIMVL